MPVSTLTYGPQRDIEALPGCSAPLRTGLPAAFAG
jgi:hypothetical protein